MGLLDYFSEQQRRNYMISFSYNLQQDFSFTSKLPEVRETLRFLHLFLCFSPCPVYSFSINNYTIKFTEMNVYKGKFYKSKTNFKFASCKLSNPVPNRSCCQNRGQGENIISFDCSQVGIITWIFICKLHMERYFCNSKMGNILKPFPAESKIEKIPQAVHG